MIKINLYGCLAEKLGSSWELDVKSIMEIFEALEANNRKENLFFRTMDKFFTHFIVYIDGKIMPPHLLKSKLLKKDSVVDILPVVQGGFVGALIIIGVVLIVLSFVLTKLLTPKEPVDIKTSSSVLGKIKNVTNRNIPVPVGYGRFRVGSAVISNDIIVFNGAEAQTISSSVLDIIKGS
jgi:predicted phage tail protein